MKLFSFTFLFLCLQLSCLPMTFANVSVKGMAWEITKVLCSQPVLRPYFPKFDAQDGFQIVLWASLDTLRATARPACVEPIVGHQLRRRKERKGARACRRRRCPVSRKCRGTLRVFTEIRGK